MRSESVLEMADLCIRSRDRILVDGVSVTVYAGKITAVVGSSGSGKSLSARAAMGMVHPDLTLVRGTLRYPRRSDEDLFAPVRGAGRRARRQLMRDTRGIRGNYVTYSPQSASSALNPGRTLGRQLELAVGRRDTPTDDVSSEIVRILGEVGLTPRTAGALPGELSGGMAQRAALAIAIAPRPDVLIADEPETGLDPVLRRVVTELLLQVAARYAVGLMLITHNHDTVARIADEIVTVGEETP